MTHRLLGRTTAVLVVLLSVPGCTSTGNQTGGSSTNPPPAPTTSNPAVGAWTGQFCGVVSDLKAAVTRAVNEASAKYPSDLKHNVSATLGQLSDELPTIVSRLRDLGPSPLTNADRTVDALTREVTKIHDSMSQAKKEIDALPGNDEAALQRIMKPIHPQIGALATIPLNLITIPGSVRQAGDGTPACKGILDHETPPDH